MAEFDYRNPTLNYTRPNRTGSARGSLVVLGAIIAVVFIGMLFIGGGENGTVPVDPEAGAAPVPLVNEGN